MAGWRRFFLKLINALGLRRSEAEMSREIASHLALLEHEFQRRGMTAAEARPAARRAFGGVEQTKELHRDARSFRWLDDGRRDVRHAVRALRRTPVFTAVAVTTLALGIGANTAIFSAVDAVLIQRLPYGDPDRLVMVWEDATAAGFPRNTPAPGNYSDWARLNRVFSGMAASAGATANLIGDGVPEQVLGRRVTPNFFGVLGVQPLMGRTFTEDDERTGAAVVIISYDLWRRRYGQDPSMIGRTVLMDDKRYDVIGVMPRSFVYRRNDIDYWIPTHFTPSEAAERRSHYLNVVARLKPRVSVDAANAEMHRVSAALQREYPEINGNAHITTTVAPMKADLVGNARVELPVLMGAAAAVLLIACANLASLLLSRAVSRRGELAVRVALGATRARLFRQMLIEAMTLSIAGGLLALAMAPAGISLIAQLVPDGLPSVSASVLDLRLLSFTFAAALFAAVIFSTLPAWQATRAFGSGGLGQGTRSVVGPDTGRARDMLIVLQLAVALMLLVGAGLMLRTIENFRAVDLGFRPDPLLTLRTTLPRTRYSEPVQRLRFYNQVIAGVRELAGVEDAAYASTLPFTTSGNTSWYQIEGVTLDPDDPADTLRRVGTSDYLKTLGVTLVEGRLLDRRDDNGAPLAVVINETMARRYWPHETPLGRRIRFGPSDPFYTIVGVIKDIRERGYELAMKPAVYLSAAQWRVESTDNLVVRVVGNPRDYANAIRRVIASVNPDQPVASVRTMDEILDRDLGNRQLQMFLFSAFAGIALILALVGVYGVLSYSVAQRSREFGVRIALGASASSVIRVVVARGLSLMTVGLSIGLALAWTAARAMKSLLYGVASSDPTTFTAVVLLLACTGMIASYLPARRASCVDVMEVLRHD